MPAIFSSPVITSLAGLLFALGGLLLVVLGMRSASTTEDAVRLREYVMEESLGAFGPVPRLTFRQAELAGSLRNRLVTPVFRRVGRLLGSLTPTRLIGDLQRQLAAAGNPLGLGPREFYSLRLICGVVGIVLAFVIFRGGITQRPLATAQRPLAATASARATQASAAPSINFSSLVGSAIAVYGGLYLPKVWLRGRVKARQVTIRKSLPDALDMLSVCADAGLGFDQALQRVSERWKTPLGAEFGRVVAEMQMGVQRQAALHNLADRVNVTELNSFVAVIVQSDQLGMSIVQTLRAQAEQMRVERRHRAQEEARKAPLKMLFPMLLFIFPSMFAVILGPAIPQINAFFVTLRETVNR